MSGQWSVVTPTLDAREDLAGLREAFGGSRLVGELVASDGGSRDGTCEEARALGFRVVEGERGRGGQLMRGAEAARGEWLLFWHADTRPGEGWEEALEEFTKGGEEEAGAFRLRLDDEAKGARRVERLARWRMRAWGLPYGDQGCAMKRSFYEGLGGYRDMPLMEDVDLARRVGRRRWRELDAEAMTSARRYKTGGYTRRSVRNLCFLGMYYMGVSPRRLSRWY